MEVDDQHIRNLAFKVAEYQRLGLRLPKSFVSTYVPPQTNTNTGKISKNKKNKLKKKAKRQKELLEQNINEILLTENEIGKKESLNGLKDNNLKENADACTASIEKHENKLTNSKSNLDAKTNLENLNNENTETEKNKLETQLENNKNETSELIDNHSNKSSIENVNEKLKNSNNSSSNLNNSNSLDNLKITTSAITDLPSNHQGNESRKINEPNMTNNFSIIFEEIQQHHPQINSNERQPDPATEVCKVNVKIADLGNACWIVC